MERRVLRRPQHVLIADDSEDLRALWRAVLTHWGFTVDEASNGLEALQRARARRPDLILMDCWMPILDGLSATAQLRADPGLSKVPVLAISAAAMSHSGKQAAMDAGCDTFVHKPLLPEQLIHQVRLLLRQGRGE